MSDNHRESNEGGFHLNTDGLNCLPCSANVERRLFTKKLR